MCLQLVCVPFALVLPWPISDGSLLSVPSETRDVSIIDESLILERDGKGAGFSRSLLADRLGWAGLGWAELSRAGLGWAGLGWAGLDWAGWSAAPAGAGLLLQQAIDLQVALYR